MRGNLNSGPGIEALRYLLQLVVTGSTLAPRLDILERTTSSVVLTNGSLLGRQCISVLSLHAAVQLHGILAYYCLST